MVILCGYFYKEAKMLIRDYRKAPHSCLKCRSRNLIILYDEDRPNVLLCKKCQARNGSKYQVQAYSRWNMDCIAASRREYHHGVV